MKKPYSNILSQQEIATKFDQMEKTDADESHLDAENIFVLESFHKPNRWELFQQAQLSDRSEVHIVNILDEYIGSSDSINMQTWRRVRCDIQETERFVNEIHTHEAETTSSGELLENLQESKESMSY